MVRVECSKSIDHRMSFTERQFFGSSISEMHGKLKDKLKFFRFLNLIDRTQIKKTNVSDCECEEGCFQKKKNSSEKRNENHKQRTVFYRVHKGTIPPAGHSRTPKGKSLLL